MTADAGGTVEIEVQTGATEVEVGLSGASTTTKYPVGPGGKAQIPVPPNAAGSFLLIITGGAPPPSTLSILILETE